MEIRPKDVKSAFSLKFNPFLSEIPISCIYQSPEVKNLLWRLEGLVIDGGIAMIQGEPGLGKSILLRIIEAHLREIPDINVAIMKRPQSNMGDFYRELGELFQIELKLSNRWGGFRLLREKWIRHIDSTLFRPVLIVDEAQQMNASVMTEMRLLASDKLDSRKILTVILAGDQRLENKMHIPDLLPLYSRIRLRHMVNPLPKDELAAMLRHIIHDSGNKNLMSEGLIANLSEHSCGNPRLMMHTADELLCAAAQKNCSQLDESLYFEVFQERLKKPAQTRRKS